MRNLRFVAAGLTGLAAVSGVWLLVLLAGARPDPNETVVPWAALLAGMCVLTVFGAVAWAKERYGIAFAGSLAAAICAGWMSQIFFLAFALLAHVALGLFVRNWLRTTRPAP